ncbi:MAG TPA: adenylate/guanylate cyclase domain-containing protein, partial [Actinomycetota bacterium]|nr:adenylate/guanylate cyclase domain-containing protein [Actinomycetota bacterium]
VYDRFAGLSAESFRDVSEREGIPLELLLVVRDAIGFAQADPDDAMREDELLLVPLLRLQLARGVSASAIEEWLRVYGDALRRITETEANVWYTQITLPQLAAGLNEAQMQELTAKWGDEFDPLMDRAVLAIYHAHQEHTWTEVLVEVVESALDRAGLRTKMRITPAICFVDLTGFTDLTERSGDEAAADVASRMAPLVRRTVERHSGKVVKWLGDGVMLYFGRPEDAVSATMEIVEATTDAGLPPAHAGIHMGPVVFQGADYFGRTVNVAARIMERAQRGQILVSDNVAQTVDGGTFTLSPIGPVELKGVPRPMRLHSVERGRSGPGHAREFTAP